MTLRRLMLARMRVCGDDAAELAGSGAAFTTIKGSSNGPF